MKLLVCCFYILQIIFLILLFFVGGDYSSIKLNSYLLLFVVDLVLFIYLRHRSKYKSNKGIWSLCFVIGYTIVFFQKYVDISFGYTSPDSEMFVSRDTIIPCIIISLSGFVSFCLGYILFKYRRKHKTITIKHENIDIKWFNYLLPIITLLYAFFNLKYILANNYSQAMLEAKAGTMALYSEILLTISYVSYIVFFIIKYQDKYKNINFISYVKKHGFLCNLSVLVYVILIIISGDRGPLIIFTLIYIGAYFIISNKVLNFLKISVLVVFAAFFLTGLGQLRKSDTKEIKTSFMAFTENDKSVSPLTSELASSVLTLHYSVYNVPSYYPYNYGIFQLKQILSSIPFMNHIVYVFADPHFKYKSSAFFMTWLIQGDAYTYGNGISCNADLYLSFGIWGVIIGLLLWGILFSYVEQRLAYGKLSITFLPLSLFMLAYSIYVNRASLLCFLNYIVFTIIFCYLYKLLIYKR